VLIRRSCGTCSNVADLFDQIASLINDFNLFDWLILLVWVVSSIYGVVRGFAREALSILGWVSAFLARKYAGGRGSWSRTECDR
jgi:hypothetical protein